MKRKIASIIFILLILITKYTFDNNFPKSMEDFQKVVVSRVVDGDTIVIDSGEKIRFILVNAPESVHSDKSKNTELGKLASDYTTNMLLGKTIYLEKDISNTDKYGRLLRYVYLEDGTLFNELLVKEGYASLATYPPDLKYQDIIAAAEKYARDNNKGLWKYED